MLAPVAAGNGFSEQIDAAAARRDQPDQQPADGGFPRAGLADEPERLAGENVEAYLVHRMQLQRRAALVAAPFENLDEVANRRDSLRGIYIHRIGAHDTAPLGGQRAKRAGPAASNAGAS